MYILGFETTGPICSVALLDLDNPSRLFMLNGNEPMSHLKSLTDNARRLMADSGVDVKGIAAAATSIGPGSFTGIRIGVTTARTVAQALDIPCIAVPTLEIFRSLSEDCTVVPIFNARRGQVYGAIFSRGVDVLVPGPYMLEDVLAELEKYIDSDEVASLYCASSEGAEECVSKKDSCIVFYGDGVDAYSDRLNEFKNDIESVCAAGEETSRQKGAGHNNCLIEFADEDERYQTADLVVRFAAEKLAKGETCTVDELIPVYMRKAEAEQKLEDGTLQKLREEKLARLMAGN
ncbi:MAG: tRNA (adenosine(37)-N6)-threonylcarbamoyltransferase complex dimerization subunit type 1 TsaB [Firmicutes bacterium]|nr:tRNA (adenosine(37)-N6)-threonylcarbamoyltransferase complex dimerization subunit type 1 TsaB [Bacillota bacterium]